MVGFTDLSGAHAVLEMVSWIDGFSFSEHLQLDIVSVTLLGVLQATFDISGITDLLSSTDFSSVFSQNYSSDKGVIALPLACSVDSGSLISTFHLSVASKRHNIAQCARDRSKDGFFNGTRDIDGFQMDVIKTK